MTNEQDAKPDFHLSLGDAGHVQAPTLIAGAPLGAYSPEDQAFYRFWYGHMRDDLMQPPLAEVTHRTARYIWDAAIESRQSDAQNIPKNIPVECTCKAADMPFGRCCKAAKE